MKVILAETAGFCFGVKRAVDTVYRQIAEHPGRKIYTYGPIIHNAEVIRDMEARGVTVLRGEDELEQAKDGIVIIRSHGVPKRVCDRLEELGIPYVDATCPYVKKIHRIAMEEEEKGNVLIIIGNSDHPEVEGIKGWAGRDSVVVSTIEDAAGLVLPKDRKICVVAQTTYNYNKFKDIVEIILKKGYDIIVLNTICSATQERQVEASRIASEVDVMIVIGDKKSSNSQKLYEICQKKCKNTYFIQTVGDFNPECVNSVRNVGITAGASTPKQIIEEVHANARIK